MCGDATDLTYYIRKLHFKDCQISISYNLVFKGVLIGTVAFLWHQHACIRDGHMAYCPVILH